MKELTKLDARIPQWDFDDLLERVCPICGSVGIPKYIRPDQLYVRWCQSCGLLYVSPSPSESQLIEFYSVYATEHQRLSCLPDYEIAQDILVSTPEENVIMQEICSMKNIQGARCLDVGFGRGQYLHWIKSLGGIPVGVDLDPSSVRFAKEYLKIPDVKEGTIFDIRDGEKFDIIMLLDFIEHPLDIQNHLEKAASLLKRSGLMVVWTPNASFVSNEDDPIVLRVDLEHMQYFSFQTCNFLAEKLNLSLVHLESINTPGLLGIDTLNTRKYSVTSLMKNKLKRLIRTAPGFKAAKAATSFLRDDPYRLQRLGTYHLLCIFEKSA